MVAYAKTSMRAEKRALREKMRAMGLGYPEIAAELARRYRFRPRAAWREAYGWSLKEAAARINAHSGEVGLDPGGIAAMTAAHLCEHENWPGVGPEPSGRRPTPYLLALLAAVYGCDVTDLIDLDDREHLPPADLLILDKYSHGQPGANRRTVAEAPSRPGSSAPALASGPRAASEDSYAIVALPAIPAGDIAHYQDGTASPASPHVAYRWFQESVLGGSWVGREVEMAAHDGSEHAEQAEQRDIGEATLEQLRSDVIRLSHDYMTGEPFHLFQEMRRVRNRMYAALDRRLWPRDETDLYLLLGCLNCLMAAAADDLGYPHASEELIRAGWAYAVAIDHGPLMANLRADLAHVAYWRNRPRQSRDLAESGLRYLAGGPTAAELHLKYGRAAALMGDTDVARRAISQAWDARELPNQDDLLQLGGEFGLSRASQQYLAGSILLEISAAERDAIAELERATELYAAGPAAGEDYGFEMQMRAHIDLALARLRVGELDAAKPALRPVLALPPGKRIDPLPQRLEKVRAELASSRYHGSPQASELAEEIESFSRDTIVGALAALPG
jgi:transcriptional regulator with XRE-family HTH domain/tetratricopeptide (TPR) repeat protein